MDVITKGYLPKFWGLPTAIQHDGPAVVQVYAVKPMVAKDAGPGTEVERWRLIVCDGVYSAQCIMGSNLKHIMAEGNLQRNSLIQVSSATGNLLKGEKRLLMIADLKVLSEYGTPEKVNEQPVSMDSYEEQNGMTKSEQPQGISGNNFYGQKQNQSMAPPPAPNNGMHRGDSTHANLTPIAALSPFIHNWTIKGRITAKAPIRSWHNAKSSGRLFSVTLLDESGDIRATAFQSAQQATQEFEQWYETLQEGGVYYISYPCKVDFAKKAFSGGVKHDYEITFERGTKIERASDSGNIPSIVYNFTNIEALQNVEVGTVIDTIGVLKEIQGLSEIDSKNTGKRFTKRELTIADDSHHEVRLTIWGDSAQTFNAELESVMAFKGVKVSDFGGRSLSLTSGGSMKINPDIQEAHRLKGWYDAQGRSEHFQTHVGLDTKARSGVKTELKTASRAKEEHLGLGTENAYFMFRGSMQYLNRNGNLYYPACTGDNCNKKVIESDVNPGQWMCESCGRTMDRPQYRYTLRVCAVDHTGSLWLNLFDDAGKILMGKTADEVHEMEMQTGPDAFKDEVQDMMLWKTFNFRVRAKLDTYGDRPRVSYTVLSIEPLNYAVEANKLAEKLKEFGLMSDENSLFV